MMSPQVVWSKRDFSRGGFLGGFFWALVRNSLCCFLCLIEVIPAAFHHESVRICHDFVLLIFFSRAL